MHILIVPWSSPDARILGGIFVLEIILYSHARIHDFFRSNSFTRLASGSQPYAPIERQMQKIKLGHPHPCHP